jgi:hypothetical protein
VAASQQSASLEHRAYREAGHAVVSFLILKAGVADDLFLMPIASVDRPFLLAEFEQVSIGNGGADWSTLTFSLRSLITTSLVLLAGYASERIKYKINEDVAPDRSDLARSAWHLLGSYMEEYGEEDFSERDRQATEELIELYNLVEKELRFHWASVEGLANALLQQTVLSRDSAFEIIESNLPEETKVRVLTIASRTGQKVT